jgi:outer membrane protein assembly factor BamB
MKKLPLFFLVLFCALFATAVSAQEQARNFQIDATHTGATTSATLTPPLKQRWVVNFGQPISYPLIADGRVFVTVRNASFQGTTLFALNAANGATLWSSNLAGSFAISGACYENGRVFAVNGSGLLRAFDAATGNVVWRALLPGQFMFSSQPTVHNGVVYTGGSGSGGTVYAVDANNGALLWTRSVMNGDHSSPAVSGDGVYVSYACPNVYKLNPATGAVIWHFAPGCSGGGGKTPALYNNRLYVRDSAGTIHDAFSGALIGNFIAKNTPVFSGTRGFFLEGPNGFGSFGTLRGRDVDTNAVLWSFAGDGTLQSAVLAVNDNVYVGSASGKLYAVNAATGAQVWVTQAGTSIPLVDEHNVSQPVTSFASGEGLLVVPTSTTLVAYEGDTTAPVTQANVVGTPGANGWFKSAVQVSLSATDDFSGVANTFYNVDGGVTQTYSGPFSISAPGQHTVQFWSVDNVGNTEATQMITVKIDGAAPVVTASANPSTAPKRPQPVTVTISGSATDAVSGIGSASFNVIDEYGVAQPSGPVTVQPNGSYSFSLVLPATKHGSDKNGHLYTIVVTATDQAGNTASATTTLTIN